VTFRHPVAAIGVYVSDSYLDRWSPWYAGNSEKTAYGDTATYQVAEDHLSGLDVEDWGCGLGWFRSTHEGGYTGIDGTETQWADVVADLQTYRSTTPGLHLRHVLEHNPNWRAVLSNAAESASQRIVVTLFTPDGDNEQLDFVDPPGVPDLALPWDEVESILVNAGWDVTRSVLRTGSAYGVEAVFLGVKNNETTT
jgi:hypothetical protein